MRAANKAQGRAEADDRGRRKNAAKRARRLAEKKARSMPVVERVFGPQRQRVVDAELADPAPHGGILELFSMGYLLKLIVSRELAKLYAASVLGLLWSYIQPAIRFGVYYVIFGFILVRGGVPNYAVHLFCGMVFVHYFTETWAGGTRSIWSNRQLVMKMRVPREIFPVAAMVVAVYHTLPQLALLTVICLLVGWHVTVPAILAGLLGLALMTTVAMALALVFSALNVFFRDCQNIVQTLSQFLHFMVPMMYPFSYVYDVRPDHPLIYQLYMANPLSEAVLLMQKLFWQPLADDPASLNNEFPPDLWIRGGIMLVIGIVMLYFAQRIFARLEGRFAERL